MKTLDRIAEAMYRDDVGEKAMPFTERPPWYRNAYISQARAALTALRDNLPDAAIRQAEDRYWEHEHVGAGGGMKNAVSVAIDAILEGEA